MVASGAVDEVLIQLSYAIGVAQPVSINIDTKGTAKVDEEKIYKVVKEIFDFRPAAITTYLQKDCCLWTFWKKRRRIPMGKIG